MRIYLEAESAYRLPIHCGNHPIDTTPSLNKIFDARIATSEARRK
ncbi:hypothetical protein RSAG8_01810, partial [Rhizoctonia solani AG-8 WAC10335]